MAVHSQRALGDPVTSERLHGQPPHGYEILVRGHLGEMTRLAFPALQAETCSGDTVLRGALPDQSALHGVLTQIEALGLELLEVRRLPLKPIDRRTGGNGGDAGSPHRASGSADESDEEAWTGQ
jgi:hypothetical protein